MGTRVIEKSVEVAAPRERVWQVLLEDATYRQWSGVFFEGSYAETDWQEGSTVRFLGPSGEGLLGHVVTARHPELVDVEHDGLVVEGRDDTDSEAAREHRGTRETYRLTATPGGTRLHVSAPMSEDYDDDVLAAWDRALAEVAELAEATAPSGRG
ncbi:SRPBCC family protein [Quadrisphaera sp. KR29]|uniref:SRPBCC family protein n=1 Tax=Quadrisphaera sp. KR29 TaxID=3461391 RepID=UPI004043A08C